jgi:replicative DNA helicase
MTTKFIYSLLRANRSQQEAFFAKQIPRVVFREAQAEIRWIYDYRARNGSYPSLSSFKHRFPNTALPKTKDNIDASLQSVLDNHLFNEMCEVIDKAKSMHSGGLTMQEVVGYVRKASQDISIFDNAYVDEDIGKSNTALSRYLKRVSDAINGKSNHAPSPWKFYNELLGYNEYGEHNIITARTGLGKSWVALFWAEYLASIGERVLVVTKEMPTAQIADRTECIRYQLSHPHFRKGTLDPADLARWKKLRRQNKYPSPFGQGWVYSGATNAEGCLVVTGQETITGVGFSHIIAKIQQYRPTVVFVDGAYLITPEGISKNAGPVEKFTAISNRSKQLAKAFSVLWFSIIQVNRESENKAGDTTPSLKNIYGADAWAQDADNVIILGGKRGASTRIFSLAKCRESNIGEFAVRFELSPRPDFSQLRTLKSVSSEGSVEFQGI